MDPEHPTPEEQLDSALSQPPPLNPDAEALSQISKPYDEAENPWENHPNYGKPWGFWATLGLGVTALLIWILAQTVAILGLFFGRIAMEGGKVEEIESQLAQVEFDGFLLGMSALISSPFAVLACFGFAALRRRNGISVKEYLGLKPISWKAWIYWPVATFALMFAVDFVLGLFGAPEVEPWMQEMSEKGTNFGWMFVAVIICAPLVEEFLFRGFFFKGWMASGLGVVGTIIATNLIWTLIHIQYGVYGMSAVFTLGIMLGISRVVSGSIWAPVLIHFVNNAFASYGMWEMSQKAAGGG